VSLNDGFAERLGAWCVTTGLATREEIDDCLRLQKLTPGARLADILVSRGILTHRQVGQALAVEDQPVCACPDCRFEGEPVPGVDGADLRCARCRGAQDLPPSPEAAGVQGTPASTPSRRRAILAGAALIALLAVAGLLGTEDGAPDPAAAFAEREAQVWRRLAGLEAEEAEREAVRLLALCGDGPLEDRAARLADEARWVARVLRRASGPEAATAPADPTARITHLERALRVPDDRDRLGLAILSLRSGLPGSESRFRDLLQTSLAPVAERYLTSFGTR
jgi:hypothetical protein